MNSRKFIPTCLLSLGERQKRVEGKSYVERSISGDGRYRQGYCPSNGSGQPILRDHAGRAPLHRSGGFARTFFLRPLFDVPPIPGRLYLHGVLQASWFCLLVVQATLVAKGRGRLHRRLGVGGAILAAAIAAVTLYTLLRFPARLSAGKLSTDVTFDPAIVLWTDYAELGVYTTFVSAAVWFRRRPDVHKRLMLLASIALVAPALSRMIAPVAPTLLPWLTAHHLPPLARC